MAEKVATASDSDLTRDDQDFGSISTLGTGPDGLGT